MILKVAKRLKNNCFILENEELEMLIFKTQNHYICVRRRGNIVLDKNWDYKLSSYERSQFKEFLGGMFIQEVRKEVKSGLFKTCNLDNIMNS